MMLRSKPTMAVLPSLFRAILPHASTYFNVRRRLASFALEEFQTALEAFRQGEQMFLASDDASATTATVSRGNSDPRKYRTWIRKCEAEMEADDGDNVEPTVKGGADDEEVEARSSAVASQGDSGATATKAVPLSAVAAHSTPAASDTTTDRAPVSSAPVHLRTKFQYYQSYDKVTVAVLEKGLKEDEVDVEIGTKRLTVRRRRDSALLFDKVLYEEVLPDQRKTRFVASKVCVK